MRIAKNKIVVKPFKYDNKLENNNLSMHPYFKRLTYMGLVVSVSNIKGLFDCCSVGDIIIYERYIGIDINYNSEPHEVIDQSDVVCIMEGGINYEIPHNYVLVRLLKNNTESNTELSIDPSYQKERYATTYGQVLVAPKKLLYFGDELKEKHTYSDDAAVKMMNASMNWKSEAGVEVKYGDIVHFNYLSVESAEIHGLVIKDKITDEKIYLIRYDLCYAFERGSEIRFINGFCGVDITEKPTSQISESGLYELCLDEKNQKKWGYGKIMFDSSPNLAYILYDVDERNIDVSVGDSINFKHTKKMKIGNDLLIKNEKLRNIHLIQKKDINFIIQ